MREAVKEIKREGFDFLMPSLLKDVKKDVADKFIKTIRVGFKMKWSSKNGHFFKLSFLSPESLKILGREVIQVRMKLFAIVEHFNVVNDIVFGILTGFVVVPVSPLCLETAKESFHY